MHHCVNFRIIISMKVVQVQRDFIFLQKLNLVTSKLINHVALLSKIDTYDFFNHDRVSHDCVIILGVIQQLRGQNFAMF